MSNQAGEEFGEELKTRCKTVAQLLKIMSHPQRLMILCVLAEGEKTAGEIERACDGTQSSVSQFLKEMRLQGLVSARREGRFRHYRIKDQRVTKLIHALHGVFCRKRSLAS